MTLIIAALVLFLAGFILITFSRVPEKATLAELLMFVVGVVLAGTSFEVLWDVIFG